MDFRQVLLSVYKQKPCQVLPNAFWKTAAEISRTKHSFTETGGQVTGLRLWDAQRLLVYWKLAAQEMDFSEVDVWGLQLALVHERALPRFPASGFSQSRAYFRLTHSLNILPPASLPAGFVFQAAQPEGEAEEIAALINRCYPNMRQTTETVLGWAQHPVYDPALWLWLVDKHSGRPAALGIAEYDPFVREGSLEWVQVLLGYRRQGLGSALVFELLGRLHGKAEFVTVSGEMENESSPEALYQRCGFEGDDVWWVFTR